MNLETLYIQIEAETSKIKSQVATVNKQFQGMENTLNKTFSNITKAAVAAFSVAAVVRYGKAIIQTVDTLKELNAQTGISTQRIQELQYATDQTGGNFESIKRGIQTLNEQIVAGNPVLAQLGIDITNTETAFNQVLNVLADMPESADKAVLGQQLLGRSFLELRPLLNEGSVGIAKLSKAARDSGFVMSTSLVNAIDNLGDSFSTLGNIVKASVYPILEAIIPIIQKVVNWLIIAAGFISGIIQAMFGYKKSETDAAKSNTATTKTIVSNAAKIKRAYSGFDELNVISSDIGGGSANAETSSNLPTGGTSVFDAGLGDAEDIMKGFNAEVEKGKKFWEDYGNAIKVATAALALFWAAWTFGPSLVALGPVIAAGLETAFLSIWVWLDDLTMALYVMFSQGAASASVLQTTLYTIISSLGVGLGGALAIVTAIILAVIATLVALFQLFTEKSPIAIKFQETFANSWALIKDALMGFWTFFEPYWNIFKESIVLFIQEGLAPLWDSFKELVAGVFRFATVLFNFLWPILKVILEIVGNLAGALIGVLGSAFMTVLTIVVNVISVILKVVADLFNIIADGLESFQKDIWEPIWDAISKTLGNAWDFMFNNVKEVWDKIKEVFSGFKDFLKGIINSAAMVWNTSLGAFKFDIPKWVPVIGGLTWEMPKIPMLAQGGMLNAGSLFVAGEAGAELIGSHKGQTTVMPLQNTDFTAAMGQAVYGAMVSAMSTQGNGSVVINVDGMTLAKSVETNLNKLSTLQGGLKIAM